MSGEKQADCIYFRVRHWVPDVFLESNYGPFPPRANDEHIVGKILAALAGRSDVLGIELVLHNSAEPLPAGRLLDDYGRAKQ